MKTSLLIHRFVYISELLALAEFGRACAPSKSTKSGKCSWFCVLRERVDKQNRGRVLDFVDLYTL